MRPIKFRGFQNSWIYGGISIFNGEATIYDESCVANSAYDVDIESVGQYTGLSDKNGTEIYDGDFLECSGVVFSVNWDNENACFRVYRMSENQSVLLSVAEGVVIGNIYENPELLPF